MRLKAFLVMVAITSGAFFLYILVEIERCCEEPRGAQEESLSPEESTEAGVPLETRVLHFGDLMLGRGVGRSIERGINPLKNIETFIRSGSYDAVIANLEGPFTRTLDCQVKPYSFRFEPETVTLLSRAGITAVTLANNHSNDCYEEGIEESQDILHTANIASFGDHAHSLPDGSHWYSEKLGVTFFGFDTTLGLQTAEEMGLRVSDGEHGGSRLVAHIHWGDEYEPYPNSSQRSLATLLANEGVSLIIGHHPHVIEPAEIINDTVVFYSLGNFVFDQDTIETQTGYAVEEHLIREEGGEILMQEYVVHPYRIVGHVPTLLWGEERQRVCERVLSTIEVSGDDACSFLIKPFDKELGVF